MRNFICHRILVQLFDRVVSCRNFHLHLQLSPSIPRNLFTVIDKNTCHPTSPFHRIYNFFPSSRFPAYRTNVIGNRSLFVVSTENSVNSVVCLLKHLSTVFLPVNICWYGFHTTSLTFHRHPNSVDNFETTNVWKHLLRKMSLSLGNVYTIFSRSAYTYLNGPSHYGLLS